MIFFSKKFSRIVALSLLVFMGGVEFLQAATVSSDQSLSVNSADSVTRTITINSGSTFNELTVAATSLTFVLGADQDVTLVSSQKQQFETNQGVSTTCGDSTSTLTLNFSATTTVIVTMPGVACSAGSTGSSGTGGSSGGGGSTTITATTTATSATTTSNAATTTAAAPVTTTPSVTMPVQATPPVVPPVSFPPGAYQIALNITRHLSMNSVGKDVEALQQVLAKMTDIYPQGLVTGRYGTLTKAAVQRFQEKYNIAKAGDLGYGSVGPKTRAKLMEVFNGTGMMMPSTTPAIAGMLTRALQLGSSGDDVSALQTFLAKNPELYPEGLVTGYYGSLTVKAVRRFQAMYGISQVGRVGPMTLQKLNELMGGSSAMPMSSASSAGEEAKLKAQLQDLQNLVNNLTLQLQTAQ